MRRSSRLACVVLFGLLALPACAERGSGTSASAVREVAAFKSIDLDLTGELNVTIGSPQRLEVTADDNLLPFIRTDVDAEGKLSIRCEKAYMTSTVFRYDVTMPALEALKAGRNAVSTVSGLAGGGLALDVGWETQTTLKGAVDDLAITASGRSKTDASGLAAKRATVAGDENALVKVHATERLTAAAKQRAKVEFAGDPEVTLSENGKGRIRKAVSR